MFARKAFNEMPKRNLKTDWSGGSTRTVRQVESELSTTDQVGSNPSGRPKVRPLIQTDPRFALCWGVFLPGVVIFQGLSNGMILGIGHEVGGIYILPNKRTVAVNTIAYKISKTSPVELLQ